MSGGHAFGVCKRCGCGDVVGGWCPTCGGVRLGRWENRGLCVGKDPVQWTPDGTKGKRLDVSGALALCQRCPVRAACLRYAESLPGTDGVWGGALFRKGAKVSSPSQETDLATTVNGGE